jgi:CRP-like cAMP-binding protein
MTFGENRSIHRKTQYTLIYIFACMLSSNPYKLNPEALLDASRPHLVEFTRFTDEQWRGFTKQMRFRHFKKGEVILSAGQREPFLSIVLYGLTRHYLLNAKGEDKSFDFSFQFEYSFAFDAFVSQQPSKFYIEALEDTLLASIHFDDLRKLHEERPEVNLISEQAAQAYQSWRQERELSLLMDDAETRYLSLMKNHPEYIQQVPLKYLASYLNIKPESLSRLRRKIAQRGN